MEERVREPAYRPDVDGLRALAVVLVVFFHAGLSHFVGGFVGVDIFFVISGFVIARMMLRERDATGTFSWRGFYLRRVRRLLPVALVVVIVTLIASAVVLPVSNQDRVALAAVAALTSTANLVQWWEVARVDATPVAAFDETSAVFHPFSHTWSLSVEEQFYLLLPVAVGAAILLVRATRLSRRTAVAAVGATGSPAPVRLSWWLPGAAPSGPLFGPFTRLF